MGLQTRAYEAQPTPTGPLRTILSWILQSCNIDNMSPQRQILPLPKELWLDVAEHLGSKDMSSLRLSFYDIQEVVFTLFGTRYFTECHVILSETSLQTLIDVSNSDLEDFVKLVVYGTEILYQELNIEKIRQDVTWESMLTRAFRNFPSLRSVRIRNLPYKPCDLRFQIPRLREHPRLQRCLGFKNPSQLNKDQDRLRCDAKLYRDWLDVTLSLGLG